MGSRGGSAPNPWRERRTSTRFLRVPVLDWPDIKVGRKSEFRRIATRRAAIFDYEPTLVVAYTLRGQTYDHRLMVLESARKETLWAISEDPNALACEGFDSYEQFRAYWKRRHGKFLPLTMVYVYRVRPFTQQSPGRELDLMAVGGGLVEHLYGEFLGSV